MISVDRVFSTPAFAAGEDSPIRRPSCHFQGVALESTGGILLDATAARELAFTPSCRPVMRSAGGAGTMMRAVAGGGFETRLGSQARAGQSDGGESREAEGVAGGCTEWVLVVVDANKAITTYALDWALNSVVREGYSVKLLGVLHHILNPSELSSLGFLVAVGFQLRVGFFSFFPFSLFQVACCGFLRNGVSLL